ncbi:flagellin N-terminal helical domain-containing protein [Laribacter hongkongensis]|uniref:flagellin N-terminal helical domain-containing protein n=1 Tax=Laribacter hongkongensis TaxID=168471 RepID=UPI001877BF17|nr:flagellin [Laribacter hongkongensis]
MLGINTNVTSLTAQRNLSGTTNAMSTTLQRLSSGLRINSAKDDAAGLAISDRMTSQIRGLDQARRNANDGVSLAQTAEGALSEIGSNLQRIRELAVQSANATNTSDDRKALQGEMDALVSEIDRVAGNTEFNGIKLLNGGFTGQKFQVGANSGQTISVDKITDARTSQMGKYWESKGTVAAADVAVSTGASHSINGQAIVASVAGSNAGQTTDSSYALADAINRSGISGVSAKAGVTSVAGTGTADNTKAVADGDIKVNGISIGAVAASADAATHGNNIAIAINKVSAASGVTASADATGKLTLTAADGRNIKLDFANSGQAAIGGGFATTAKATVEITSNNDSAVALTGFGALASIAANQTGSALSETKIDTQQGATDALKTLDAALKQIGTARANLGAIQNRFSSTITSLQTTSENLSASRSRIMDADFASETANLSRNQVLQQAGTAMLAQANQTPQIALQLLR